MTTPPPKRPSRLPLALLGLMTACTLSGPLVIGYVLRGGDDPNWPPDRPVEWLILVASSVLIFLVMLVCVTFALLNQKAIAEAKAKTKAVSDALPAAERPEVGP